MRPLRGQRIQNHFLARLQLTTNYHQFFAKVMQTKSKLISLIVLLFTSLFNLSAKVTQLDIHDKEVYQEGKKFGDIGTYEALKGMVYFEIDPLAEINQAIVDVQLAKRNEVGKVNFSADITILIPSDRSKINGSLIFEFNNRGGMLLPYVDAATNTLFSRGFVVVSIGWIGELLPVGNKLRLCAPVAFENEQEIIGKIRTELIGQKGKQRLNVNGWGMVLMSQLEKGIKQPL